MNYFNNKNKKGFTLVEAMVAISILSLAVTGPLVIAQKGISSAIYAKDQITASYLAQEAMEFIKNTKDNVYAENFNEETPDDWLTGLSSCLSEDGCVIDVINGDIEQCEEECPKMKIYNIGLPSEEIYVYGYDENGTESNFTRIIKIDESKEDEEAKISVEVSWRSSLLSTPRKINVYGYIFNAKIPYE